MSLNKTTKTIKSIFRFNAFNTSFIFLSQKLKFCMIHARQKRLFVGIVEEQCNKLYLYVLTKTLFCTLLKMFLLLYIPTQTLNKFCTCIFICILLLCEMPVLQIQTRLISRVPISAVFLPVI